MNKVSLNSNWLFLLIPIGIFVFVVIPQLQGTYAIFHKQEMEYESNVQKLDSLKLLEKPSSRDKTEIKRLEITVPVSKLSIERQRYGYYKTGGMLAVLAFMFVGMFGSSYLTQRKKNAPTNRQIEFHYEDPDNDVIGQQVLWNAQENSGSNFLSERLKKTASGYKISSSNYMKFAAWSFFLMGLNYVVWALIEYFKFNKEPLSFMKAGKLFFTSGGVFMLVGAFLLMSTMAKVYFLMQKRIIVTGKDKIPFQQVYALQVLEKFVQGKSSGGYSCYELNLVTVNGTRFNLLNHGDKEYLLSDMVTIARFLKVPVWNKGVV